LISHISGPKEIKEVLKLLCVFKVYFAIEPLNQAEKLGQLLELVIPTMLRRAVEDPLNSGG
jgi:hypothetical protein